MKPLAAFSVEFHCSNWEEVKALLHVDQFLLALALVGGSSGLGWTHDTLQGLAQAPGTSLSLSIHLSCPHYPLSHSSRRIMKPSSF